MTSIEFQVRLAALLMIVALATTLAIAQTPAPAPSLDTLVRAETAPFKGKVYLFAKNLDTGVTYSFNGDERVRTASTIKVAVMIEAFTRVADGRAKWTDELVLTKAVRYGGSGVLPELADGLRLTLRDCVNLMMVVSDNTATNMVLQGRERS
jgi:beta-lactamase class A